jgi:hypothetical protein
LKTLAQRFHAKVGPQLPSGCMEWQANRDARGYGRIRVFTDGKWTNALAHRVAYTLDHDDIPSGMVVMHACDNPSCVNVEHLRLGLQQHNSRSSDHS